MEAEEKMDPEKAIVEHVKSRGDTVDDDEEFSQPTEKEMQLILRKGIP